MNKYCWWALAAIVLLGIGLRSYQLTRADIADFHAWRQADTAAFTRGYLVDTLNPFYPSVDRYPCAYRGEHFGRAEAELPLVAWMAALPLAALGMDFPPAPYLRAISILFYALTSLYLFLLVLRLDDDPPAALLAVLAFTLLPVSIFFTRTIQPDGPSLFFAVGFLYHLTRWLEADEGRHGFLSAAFGALAMLLKISNGYLIFPAIYLFVSRKTLWGSLKTPKYWVWGGCIVLPAVLWYLHAHQFPWTFGIWGDEGNSKFATWRLITSPGSWRKLSERLTFDLLTWGGVLLLLVGLAQLRERRAVRLGAVWALGFALLVCIALRGNLTHVYYQLPIVLPAAILIGAGIRALCQQQLAGKVTLAVAALVYALTAYHILIPPAGQWQQGYFGTDIPANIQEATRLVREHVKPGERFISATRHPALFFNAHRRGWFYEGKDTLGFIGCSGPDATTILWSQQDVTRARASMREHPELKGHLEEIVRGQYFSLWRVRDLPMSAPILSAIGTSSGGDPFYTGCPAGQALQGFETYSHTAAGGFNALAAICAPLANPTQSATQSSIHGQKKPDAHADTITCPPGEWVAGITTRSIGVVRDLQLACTPTPGAESQAKDAPTQDAETNRCPPGQIARSIYGRAGISLDAIGLRCAALTPLKPPSP